MNNSYVLKGNICQTKNPKELDLYEKAFAVCVDGISKVYSMFYQKNMRICLFMTMVMQ